MKLAHGFPRVGFFVRCGYALERVFVCLFGGLLFCLILCLWRILLLSFPLCVERGCHCQQSNCNRGCDGSHFTAGDCGRQKFAKQLGETAVQKWQFLQHGRASRRLASNRTNIHHRFEAESGRKPEESPARASIYVNVTQRFDRPLSCDLDDQTSEQVRATSALTSKTDWSLSHVR